MINKIVYRERILDLIPGNMKIKRMLTNICSEKLKESMGFYTQLFDFSVDFDSDWFVHLISKDRQLELGIINVNSQIVPNDIKDRAKGSYITFVVDNVDELYKFAKTKQFKIIQDPEDTFYGQRRMLLKDPNDYIIDVSSEI